jgi:pimeloyl-ACP methyl ester carboxylesterase
MIDHQAVRHEMVTAYPEAPTRTIDAGGVSYAYRELGPKTGVPVVFLTHLAAVLDNWDPRVVDGIAAVHRVITFDNRGVGASTGKTRTRSRRWRPTLSPSSVPWVWSGSICSASRWAA